MATIVVDDLLINYEQSGKGRGILLLHGWGDSLQTFHKLAAELGKNNKVTALDLPGFGKSQPPKEPWDLDDYSAFLKNFVKKTGAKPSIIIAHSNGGALAIRALAQKEISAQKLILLASSGVRKPGGIKRTGIKAVAKVGKVATIWLPKSSRQSLQKKLYGTVGSDMLVVPELKETFKRTVRQDIQQDAAKLQQPTLLIYGEQDRATPVVGVGSRLRHHIRNSHFIVLHGAEHFVHHDQPEKVAELIKDFIR